jgi:hypothetical protein
VGERRNQLARIEQDIERLERGHEEEKNETKKASVKSELEDAKKRQDEIHAQQQSNRDSLFLPCYELFEALVGREIKISNWRLTWDVRPTTTGKREIPLDISGGLTVVGVVGTDAGQSPVKFEAEKKK